MIIVSGKRSAVSTIALQSLKRVILPIAALLVAIVALGLLVTKVLDHAGRSPSRTRSTGSSPATATESWNSVSLVFSTLASTRSSSAVTVLVAIVLRLWLRPLAGVDLPVRRGDLLRRWSSSSPPWSSTGPARTCPRWTNRRPPPASRPVTPRPRSPSTSAWPCVLALIVRRTWLKWLCWALVLVPVAVALSRLYRGMHHPSDVIASFINGGICVAVTARSVLDRSVQWGRQKVSA